MYYIAYGSNLSEKQMAKRCPDAELVGKGLLKGYKLVFRTHANIEKRKGSSVPVLVWDISEKDEQKLDQYEGFPTYYIKENLELRMTDMDGKKPKKITAMVYIMTKKCARNVPSLEYFGIISEAYKKYGFDEEILLDAMAEVIDCGRGNHD